jgi:hypothetical protein
MQGLGCQAAVQPFLLLIEKPFVTKKAAFTVLLRRFTHSHPLPA